MAKKRSWDWPQVVLVGVVGALALAACAVLGVTWDKLASIPVSEWTLIASALAGVVGTVIAAFRRPITEPPSVARARVRESDTPGDA